MSSENLETSAQKISILGLSNAGKTSILKVLTREFEMLTVIKPTAGIERNFLEIFGNEIVVWDFGGQETYRGKYLSQPERYFGDIAYVYYVIDIQDPDLLGENIMYFQSVAQKILKYSPKAQFITLFHKLDPDYERPKVVEVLQEKFLKGIEKENVNLNMYYTSIYNPLSIIKAFSQPLFDNQELGESFKKAFKSFADTYNLLFISLLTKNSFELGYYAADRLEQKYPGKLPVVFKSIFLKLDPKLNPPQLIDIKVDEIQVICSIFQYKETKNMKTTGLNKESLILLLGFDEESILDKEGLEVALNRMDENLKKIFNTIDLFDILKRIKR